MTNADVKEFRLRLDAIERGQKDMAQAMTSLAEAIAGKRSIDDAAQEAASAYARLYVRRSNLFEFKPKTSRRAING